MVRRILKVIENTVFKLRPELSSELTPEEIYEVAAGTTFEIQSYAYANANGDFDGHIKFALAGSAIRGLNTWFVYSLHVQVEFDGVVVYPHEDQENLPILRISEDTTFKLRPIQASILSPNEIEQITKGRSFLLHSYAYADSQGDFSSHIKFALRDRKDFIRGLSTWYVYDQHAYVEFDGEIVYPAEDPNPLILRVTRDTVLKRRPVDSAQLAANERVSVQQGTTLVLESYAYADNKGDFNDHIKFAIKYAKDYINDLSTWYVYELHARIERENKVLYPIPKPTPTPTPTPQFNGRSFKLPGNSSTFFTDQPIIPGGSFTWGEATKNATRIPPTVEIVNNIIALARELQKARNQIGRPFKINSWYRPPAINQAVGGASRSQHLTGRAADIQVSGYSGRRAANALMAWWNGGIGIYSNLPNVLHLDVGPRRYWGF
ncbi:MAG: D-Ala-D-Ala carboxypeptidase family metallohydrolase [Oculatellaceae cyanobacterium bins.114]|nr:D-Ala-D-Ala carboxypeptidase family metallohydrolase [Oculatellaceae cyanobacterium bins.114]